MSRKKLRAWLIAAALLIAAGLCAERPLENWLTSRFWTPQPRYPLSLLEATALVGSWQDSELKPPTPMASVPFQVIAAQPVTTLESITVENTSSAPIHDVWFFRQDMPNFHDTQALVQSVIAGRRSETEKVLALWGLFPKYYYNFTPPPASGPLFDPPTLLAVYGSAQCNYAAKVLSTLCQVAGRETHIVGIEYLSDHGNIAHCTMEVKADGKWIFMDPDGHAVYKRPDGGWASAADLIGDSTPVRNAAHAYFNPALYAEAFQKGTVTFYDDDPEFLALAKRQTNPASYSAFRHLMRYDLLPGARSTMYPGRMRHTLVAGLPLYCNGELRWKYRPQDFAEGDCRGILAENLEVATRDGALVLRRHEGGKAAALVLPFRSPYLILGGRVEGVIETPDKSSSRKVELYAAPYITRPYPTRYGWEPVGSAAGAFTAGFDELLSGAPHFGFAIKLEIPPSGAIIRSLEVVAELQGAPRALPYLTQGANPMILYAEQPTPLLSSKTSADGAASALFGNGLQITFTPSK